MMIKPLARTQQQSSILAVLGSGMAFVLILGFAAPAKPGIEGKTLKQWAQCSVEHPPAFKNAPRSIRPALVPHLIEEINSHPFQRELRYKLASWLYDYAPEVVLPWVPEPIPTSERRLNAVILLGDLGPLAYEAVPALIPLLDDEALRCSVVFTLQAIGPAARVAVPKMVRLLIDDPDLRLATAVATLAPDDPEVIRTLAELRRIGPGDVRREATAALRICEVKLS
jgi:hypothetical protein